MTGVLEEKLFKCCNSNQLSQFSSLLEEVKNAGINIYSLRSESNCSLLHQAASNNSKDIICILLGQVEKSAAAATTTSPSSSAAADFSEVSLSENEEKSKSRFLLSTNDAGYTALGIATMMGYIDCVRAILNGCTREEKKILLRGNNDIEKNRDGFSLLQLAVPHVDILRLFLEEEQDAVVEGEGEKLVDFATLSFATASKGETILHLSVKKREYLPSFQTILRACVNDEQKIHLLHAENGQGYNVLHIASSLGFSSIVGEILGGGERLTRKQQQQHGQQQEQSDSKLLFNGFQAGVRIDGDEKTNRIGSDNNTALHLAVWSGDVRTIRVLLDYSKRAAGNDVVIGLSNLWRNSLGMSPLHLALLAQNDKVFTTRFNIVQTLLFEDPEKANVDAGDCGLGEEELMWQEEEAEIFRQLDETSFPPRVFVPREGVDPNVRLC